MSFVPLAPRADPQSAAWTFGAFELCVDLRKLRKHGHNLKISPQACDVLSALVERKGEVVSREELYQRLWPDGTHVEFQGNLNALIRDIRNALNDSARDPHFIQTVSKQGYRFIAEATLGGTASAAEAPAPEPPRPPERPRPRIRFYLAGLLAVLVPLSIWLVHLINGAGPAVLQSGMPLLNFVGPMSHPAYSPDDAYIAFTWDGGGRGGRHIYIKRLGSGELLRLTGGAAEDRNACWSPDGTQIAFVRGTAPAPLALFVIPARGGNARQLAVLPGDTNLSWSADGKWIAYGSVRADTSGDAGIRAVSLADGRTIHLTEAAPDERGDVYPAFSPDGHWLAFFRSFSLGVDELHIVPLAGAAHAEGPPRRLTRDMCPAQTPAWTPDSRRIVFASERQGDSMLWSVAPFEPSPRPVLVGGENASEPAINRTGRHIVYTCQRAVDTLSRAAILGPDGRVGEPKRLDYAPRLARNPAYSPDGKWVAYESPHSGHLQIWLSASDGSGAHQLTSLRSSDTGTPHWSPDGKWIVFDARVAGKGAIYVIPSSGGTARRLTSGDYEDIVPDWSHDNRSIYFASRRTGSYQIWKMPFTGGTPVQITRQGGFRAQESPDGRELYYSKGNSHTAIWRVHPNGGEEVLMVPSLANWHKFAVTRHGIYYVPDTIPASVLFASLRPSQRPRVIAPFAADAILGFAVAPSETELLISMREMESSELRILDLAR